MYIKDLRIFDRKKKFTNNVDLYLRSIFSLLQIFLFFCFNII